MAKKQAAAKQETVQAPVHPGTDLKGRINFIILISAEGANPNGDPLNGNMPRTDMDGLGEITDKCIKRKIRDRIQERGLKILVEADNRNDDGYYSIQSRLNANPALAAIREEAKKGTKPAKKEGEEEGGNEKATLSNQLIERYKTQMCKDYYDVRAFGTTNAIHNDSLHFGVRGPVTMMPIRSVVPVEVTTWQITRATNATETDGKASDTMGKYHYVNHGLYVVEGAVNVQPAELTGFSQADADLLKDAILHMFDNDTSAARPDGSMNVCRLYWWQHKSNLPKTSSTKLYRSFHVAPNVEVPKSFDDYEVTLDKIEGCVEPEVYDLW